MSGADGLRLALGTFTIVRVRPAAPADQRTVRVAVAWAAPIGAVLGCCAAVTVEAVRQATHHSVAGVYLASVLAVAVVAALSGGRALDGLARTADALGSGLPAADPGRELRRAGIGPPGLVVVSLVLLIQTSAVAQSIGRGTGWLGVLVAVTAGRAGVVWACRLGVPTAQVAGTAAGQAGALRAWMAALVTFATAVAGAGVSWLEDDRGWWLALRSVVAVLAAAAVTVALVHRCERRLGGVTGAVPGAAVEMGTTAALLCFALL